MILPQSAVTTTAVAAQGIEYLKQVFLPDASQADVIVGYRADDSISRSPALLSITRFPSTNSLRRCGWASSASRSYSPVLRHSRHCGSKAAKSPALFGRGTPKYVCGMSGEELVAEIMRQTGWARILDMPPAALRAGSTPEYWAGWVLAYCQWTRGVRFSDILDVLSLDDIVRLHPTLHEADESRFVDVYDERAAHNRTEGDSRLHTIRVRAGLSQSGLARRSGVTLRSIQMYEQRRKDLGKAAVSTVLALARTLGCRIEDLLEP